MTFKELRAYAKQPGVKVWAVVTVSEDDEICVEVKKGDFIESLSGWTGETSADVTVDGHILIG